MPSARGLDTKLKPKHTPLARSHVLGPNLLVHRFSFVSRYTELGSGWLPHLLLVSALQKFPDCFGIESWPDKSKKDHDSDSDDAKGSYKTQGLA
jgi:hypothetical protein